MKTDDNKHERQQNKMGIKNRWQDKGLSCVSLFLIELKTSILIFLHKNETFGKLYSKTVIFNTA